MNPSAFPDRIFALARELAQAGLDSNDEVRLRSAVSRAYYAVFLMARDRLRVTASTNVHAEVFRQVRRRNGGFLLSDSLHTLKSYRQSADYDFPAKTEHQDWKANWNDVNRRAETLLQRLKTF